MCMAWVSRTMSGRRHIPSYGPADDRAIRADFTTTPPDPILREEHTSPTTDGISTHQRGLRGHKVRASEFLQRLSRNCAGLFEHWRIGMIGKFA